MEQRVPALPPLEQSRALYQNRILEEISGEPNMEYAMTDGSIVKVHRHGQGAKGDTELGL